MIANADISVYLVVMTICEFMGMDKMGKAIAVRNGNFLALRKDEQHCVVLYRLTNFFVEVYYHLDTNAVDWIRPWENSKRLQTYLDRELN